MRIMKLLAFMLITTATCSAKIHLIPSIGVTFGYVESEGLDMIVDEDVDVRYSPNVGWQGSLDACVAMKNGLVYGGGIGITRRGYAINFRNYSGTEDSEVGINHIYLDAEPFVGFMFKTKEAYFMPRIKPILSYLIQSEEFGMYTEGDWYYWGEGDLTSYMNSIDAALDVGLNIVAAKQVVIEFGYQVGLMNFVHTPYYELTEANNKTFVLKIGYSLQEFWK